MTALFHLLKQAPQEAGFSPVGFLKVGSTTLDDTTLIKKAEDGFLGEETLQQVRRIFWSRWMERKTAGLEEGERLGDVVDPNRVKTILPAAEALDFSKGAFLSIDAGMARRFRRSVEEAIARGEVPEDFERNKLLVGLKDRPAGVWPKLAAKELGLAVVSVVGEDRERVMDAYRREIPGIAFVVQARPDGTPWLAGTGHAVYFGMQMPRIREAPFVVISAGDQPLFNTEIFQRLITAYLEGRRLDPSVDLVMAHAVFEDPTNKGRVVEDNQGNVLGILEQAAIEAMPDDASWNGYTKRQLLAIQKGNVSIYVIDPELLLRLLPEIRNSPPQQKEFYLTDIVGLLMGEVGQKLLGRKGNVRSVEIPVERAPDLTELQHFRQVEATFSQMSGLEEREVELARESDGVLSWRGTVPGWSKRIIASDTMTEFIRSVHRVARVGDWIAVLVEENLIEPPDPSMDSFDIETQLIGLSGVLKSKLELPENLDLRLDLLTPQNLQTYQGFQVIRIQRSPATEQTNVRLPWAAVPLVMTQALGLGQGTLFVDVTPYLDLRNTTLQEVLDTLRVIFDA